MSELTRWYDEAKCVGHPVKVFFPEESGFQYGEALKVCQDCPVKQPCLEYALNLNLNDGVWGGLTPKQRRRLPRGRARDHTVPPRFALELTGRQHGTFSGYCGGCRCEPCTEANRVKERQKARSHRSGSRARSVEEMA